MTDNDIDIDIDRGPCTALQHTAYSKTTARIMYCTAAYKILELHIFDIHTLVVENDNYL